MSGFHEVRLPLALAFGVSGGPERLTEIVSLASGRESRNALWAGSRRRWEVGGAVLKADLAHALIAFFEARGARLNGFRFRDPVDWKSCAPSAAPAMTDQAMRRIDATHFQLAKQYSSGEGSWRRDIVKPVEGALLIAVDGVATTAFETDWTNGVVTFDSAPGGDAAVTAGFEFDTPVRFDADRLEMQLEGFDAVRVVRAPLVEVMG